MGFTPGFVSLSIRKTRDYIYKYKTTIGKFILVSGSAVILNLLLLYILVHYLGFDSQLRQNYANALAMEISIIYNFFLSWSVTWRDRQREKGIKLFFQICKFHITIGITILFRLGLFALLQLTGINYIINAAIGIGLSAVFNFLVYNTYVFKKKEN
jgi:dolichol-phosphate mannosyltransferase